MVPVVTVVGSSDSGKTRVAASLVRILTGQGLRIAAVKHCPHGHDVGRTGADSDRLYAAGADIVVASSPGKLTTLEKVEGDSPLKAIVESIGDAVDMVVAEGFSSSKFPRVVVAGGEGSRFVDEFTIATVAAETAVPGISDYPFSEMDELAAQLRACLA